MTFIDIIWNFLGFWLIIHTLIFLLRVLIGKKLSLKKSSVTSPSFLPVTSNHHHASYHKGLETGTFSLRWTTTIFNPMFHMSYRLWPKFWKIWFNIGVWYGFIAMAAGLVLLAVAGWRISAFSLNVLGQIFSSDSRPSSTHISTKHMKRAFEEWIHSTIEADSGQIFIPVIPGITLPLSHLGYYLIALLTSGIIHEAGHAIAAVSERVLINSSGLFLMGFYPGAFVDLSSRSLSLLSPFRQLRVICAGIWHNFTFFIVLWITLRWGLKLGFQLTGWKNLEGVGGVSVVNISPTSALHERLPVSSVIYRLDDTMLNHNIESWNAFLLHDDDDTPVSTASGFCADLQTAHNSLDCCEISILNPFGKSTNNSLACFEIHQNKPSQLADLPEEIMQNRFCFNTLDILAANPPRERCESNTSCHASSKQQSTMCIKPYTPYKTARIIRLYYQNQLWTEDPTDKVMVFVGERVDIWESVQVSILQPYWSFLPVWLPGVIELILSYTSSFTLALSILNILPATKLDGQHAIVCILSILLSHEDMVSSANTRSRRRIERFIVSGTTILIGFVIVGSMIVGIARVGSTKD